MRKASKLTGCAVGFLLTSWLTACSDDPFDFDDVEGRSCVDDGPEVPEVECIALVSLYVETNGPNWTNNAGWGQNSRICSWYGVTCANGHVTELSLTENGLAGTLPPAIGGLRGIEFLELGVNQLTGPIPPELGGLPNLIRLVLRENQLTGQIPVNLAFIFGLRVLSLTNNQLSGPIPPELGTLPLFFLSLAGNQLTGEIPLSFGNLRGAQFLWLYGNQLEGTVPVAVAELGGRIQRDHEPDQCRLDSNLTLSMPDTQAYRDSDHDGDGMICGLTLGGSP